MSDLSGFWPSRFLAAVWDRSSLFLSALRPVRHFPLACLLAVLFPFPGASFAAGQVYSDVVVRGATAYISPAAAQALIDALIAADMAAHPGAARNGNSVQWEESGKRISSVYSIRQGATIQQYSRDGMWTWDPDAIPYNRNDAFGRLMVAGGNGKVYGYSAADYYQAQDNMCANALSVAPDSFTKNFGGGYTVPGGSTYYYSGKTLVNDNRGGRAACNWAGQYMVYSATCFQLCARQ